MPWSPSRAQTSLGPPAPKPSPTGMGVLLPAHRLLLTPTSAGWALITHTGFHGLQDSSDTR
jgi:hypothetical protein